MNTGYTDVKNDVFNDVPSVSIKPWQSENHWEIGGLLEVFLREHHLQVFVIFQQTTV